jgi:hypothetical protein
MLHNAGYTSLFATPTASGATSTTFAFANPAINGGVATVDFIYNGPDTTVDSLDVIINTNGKSAGYTLDALFSNWSSFGNQSDSTTFELGAFNLTPLSLRNGQKIFSLTVNIGSDTSFILSPTEILFGTDSIPPPQPLFYGSIGDHQLLFVNDGAALGTVGGNEIHLAQNANGTFIQYDTNSSGGTTTASSVIQLEGITNPLQNLVLI